MVVGTFFPAFDLSASIRWHRAFSILEIWVFLVVLIFQLSGSFCSCGQPENSHTAGILPIGDEFRARIIFRGIEEIIGKRPP
jgi:hypothetical protein